MAERRMFAKTIIDSDAFLDMPLSTQALYFHLSMRADDEGFINNPKKIQRMIGASEDDLKVLIMKSFIIPFESGIVVIKHWKIHNYIRSDRIKNTVYEDERNLLDVKENGAYTISADICRSNDSQVTDECPHRLGKDSIGKDSIGKDSIGKDSIGKDSIDEDSIDEDSVSENAAHTPTKKKPVKHKYGEYSHVRLTDEQRDKLFRDYGEKETLDGIRYLDERIQMKGYKYTDHYLVLRKWGIKGAKEEKEKPHKKDPPGKIDWDSL